MTASDESQGMNANTETALAEHVGAALRENDAMVAVAESATGGLVGSALTDVPGSSAYFECSLVTYSNDAKVVLLGVTPALLAEHGAVSEPTARQMARGVCELAGTEWAVATTGIAGPSGGTPQKPVGTIYIGVAQAAESGRSTDREEMADAERRADADGVTDADELTDSEWSADADEITVSVQRYEFDGTRLENKAKFAQQALSDLLDAIEVN